jgi:hypothetical protein
VRNEEAAVAEFEKNLKAAKKLKKELEEKKTSLEDTIANRKQDKTDEEESLKLNTDDRDDELKYQAEIKPDCEWIIGAFAERAKKRTAELEGLGQAKDILAGYKHRKGGALLQDVKSHASFDDAALANVGFAHMTETATERAHPMLRGF